MKITIIAWARPNFMEISFEYVDRLPVEKNGKVKAVISLIK